MTSLKTSIKTITYLSDTGCLEIQGASLDRKNEGTNTIDGNWQADEGRRYRDNVRIYFSQRP
ncbi:hypothetical protein [Escherichia coli]|uniref:hypothetical protein n=1 Tax=Escherichia coli TaxID=562 RepID=UPI00203669AD|nr:hypothetical protein [Escherichia coli]